MRHITPLQPNIIRYLVEQNKWTELTNHIMDLQSRVGLLEVIVAEQEWRPIETAPNPCIMVLMYIQRGATGRRAFGYIETDGKIFHSGDYHPEEKVTHWMPLPKPPTR